MNNVYLPGLEHEERKPERSQWFTDPKLARAVLSERFWSKVEKLGDDECWNWLCGVDKDGYGKFQITNPNSVPTQFHVRAHRLAFALVHGRFPDQITLHQCDNARCVNPRHLRDGTQQENIAEKVARGRAARGDRHGSRTKPGRVAKGERHGMSKLKDCDIEQLLLWAREGVSGAECGRRLGISGAHACKIIQRGGRA